jgi:hypothetical protein
MSEQQDDYGSPRRQGSLWSAYSARAERRAGKRAARRDRMMAQIEWVPTWALVLFLVVLVGGWIAFVALF